MLVVKGGGVGRLGEGGGFGGEGILDGGIGWWGVQKLAGTFEHF